MGVSTRVATPQPDRSSHRRAGVFVLCCVLPLAAAPPPELPGEEITEEYIQLMVPQDSVEAKAPETSPKSSTWFDRAMKTWEAPKLAQQLAQDPTNVPMGKGAVFVPTFTEGDLEPDVEIIDSLGNVVAYGKSGRRFSMLPGTYFVMLGSGTHRQLIVREVRIEEGKTVPLIPDWAGLSIDVVNRNSVPFPGEYELVRMDKFDPYGRGFGPDPDLGEEARTWILKPGLYKIFSVGASYNTLNNFVTVQLLPGRHASFLLVEDEADFSIVSGGIVEEGIEKTLARNWQYGLDVGGSLLFNAIVDRYTKDRESNSSNLDLLLSTWLRYEKDPFDWNTRLRIDEGLSVGDLKLTQLRSTKDDVRLTSLFIWRFIRWLGLYGRFETEVDVFPKREEREEDQLDFVVVDKQDRIIVRDSLSSSRQIEAPFSPLKVELGVGANTDIVDTRYLETKFRAGFGYSFEHARDKFKTISISDIDTTGPTWPRDSSGARQSAILQKLGNATTHEAGPEAALDFNARIGRWALARAEMKLFAPLAPQFRLLKPDINLETTLSWRLSRALTLDYEYEFAWERPAEEELKVHRQEHTVRLRYSYTSR